MSATDSLSERKELTLSAGVPVTQTASEWEETISRPVNLRWEAWKRFTKNRVALVSLVIFLTACFLAVFAPFISHYDPTGVDLSGTLDQGPSSAHWLGTDSLGRDLLTRIMYGLRVPLFTAVVGTTLCLLIGAITGLAAGQLGGWIDEVLCRVTEIIFVFPGFLLIVLCIALFGQLLDGPLGLQGRVVMITIFVATDNWPPIMRLARSEALAFRETPFVEAAYLCGAPTRKILSRHLLPNILGILAVQGGLMLPSFLFVSGALSVVGMGVSNNVPDLGAMLNAGNSIFDLNPIELLAPCFTFAILILASTFIGDGLRDAFDTRAMKE